MVIVTLHQIKNVILFIHTVLVFLSSPILCLVMIVDCLQHPWVQVVERQTLNAAITQSCHVASWFICCTADNCGLPLRLPPQYTHHPFTCKHTFKKLEKILWHLHNRKHSSYLLPNQRSRSTSH